MVKTKVISLTGVLTSAEPRQFVEDALIQTLKKHLGKFGILWNPEAFRGGLRNSRLPKNLLRKLENLLEVAEASGWDLSEHLTYELDVTIEDIESFNPAFRRRLKAELRSARRELAEGKTLSVEELRQSLSKTT